MPPTSGTSLGTATGTVTINAELDAASAKIAQFSRQTEQQFNQVAASSANLTTALSQVAAGFGVGVSAQALTQGAIQIVKATIAASEAATAYDRQRVAAESLAGSQAELNAMLEVYDQATGGILDKSTELANVTQLMSVGFGDSTQELEKFATAIRGISIATGRSADTITQNLILELFSQRGQRLDQLGLQYDLVRAKADQFEQTDKSLTASMAYQMAVLDEAQRKFGALAESTEGARTGVEHVHKAWADLMLLIGQQSSDPINKVGDVFSEMIEMQMAQLQAYHDLWAATLKLVGLGPATASPAWLTSVPKSASGPLGPAAPAIDPKITEAWSDRFDKMADIQRQADADILSENTSYNQRRVDLNTNYNEQVAESAASFARQAGRAQEDYESSILDIMRDSQQQQQRMAEDHARQMARLERDHNARLQDLDEQLARETGRKRADSAEKIADMQDDLADDIAKRNIDSTKKLADIDEDYQRQRQQAARAHADTLSDAASRLDANAVFQEQRRFQREQDEAAKSHDKKVDDEQDKLQESIDNLNEAYTKKLADEQEALDKSINQAGEAHDRAIADENAAFEQQRSDANEAYALQLSDQQDAADARLADLISAYGKEKNRRDEDQLDHLAQIKTHHDQDLAKLATEHGLRITQIGTHAQEERDAYDALFRKQLQGLHVHNDAYDKAEKQHQRQIELSQGIFNLQEEKAIADMQKTILEIYKTNPLISPAEVGALNLAIESLNNSMGIFDDLIDEGNDQLSKLPQNPYDFTALTPSSGGVRAQGAPEGIVGAAAIVPVAAGTVTNSSIGGNTVNASIVINGVSGQTANDLADIIDERMLAVFQQAAGYGSGR